MAAQPVWGRPTPDPGLLALVSLLPCPGSTRHSLFSLLLFFCLMFILYRYILLYSTDKFF